MKTIKNIILLEPKQCDREVLPLLLRGFGIQTFVAMNFKDAHKLLKKKGLQIEAIILSNETMDKEHLDFANKLKEEHPKLCVLAISCRASDQEMCETRKILFMRKPITNCALIAALLDCDKCPHEINNSP